jgi:hypothetical protein
LPNFYIDATEECPDVREVIALSKKIGAISAYAYLGDVGDSVTGDKKPQKFEDDYLDELFDVLRNSISTRLHICPPEIPINSWIESGGYARSMVFSKSAVKTSTPHVSPLSALP